MTLPTALAAPVEDGLSDQSSPCLTAHMMFCEAPRPPRQSLPDGPSTVFCVAVVACTVVIRPSMIVNLSWMTLASGARQLVVHDALEMICSFGSYWSRLRRQSRSLDALDALDTADVHRRVSRRRRDDDLGRSVGWRSDGRTFLAPPLR